MMKKPQDESDEELKNKEGEIIGSAPSENEIS